jgi:Mg2+ and Co2+ transporter CorA
VIQYWEQNIPACFDPENPTIQSLAYYPLRIVAAEWVKYVDVMHTCIKQLEYQGNQLPDLTKFNMDLHELQAWRRRSMRSQEKIQAIIRRLTLHDSSDSNHLATMEALIEDFMIISSNIKIAGRRLESMLPVVTSLVQIIDARQSFRETANITRLTILALIFVPLSFVSSLFSMNSENLPGSSHFWVYFAVAIPVTLIVFIIARPPVRELQKAIQWAKSWRKQQLTLKQLQEAKIVEQKELRV